VVRFAVFSDSWLSAQRPLRRAYQQDPEAIQKWIEQEYPLICQRALRVKTEIHFGDEVGFGSDFHSGTNWGKRGYTPMVSSTGARFSANMISAVNARGKLRFMITKRRVDAKVFVNFLERLITNAPAQILLIVDGHLVHKAKSVQ
jgi:hypothetical protein